MAYCFRFRTTRAISTWPQKDSKPHTSAATAERNLKNSFFFSCHTNCFQREARATCTGTTGQQYQCYFGPLPLLLFSMCVHIFQLLYGQTFLKQLGFTARIYYGCLTMPASQSQHKGKPGQHRVNTGRGQTMTPSRPSWGSTRTQQEPNPRRIYSLLRHFSENYK